MRSILAQLKSWKYEIITAMIIVVILILGFSFRSGGNLNIYTDNISSYYFQRSNYLNETGHLPLKDIWSFGPKVAQENVPPFLAFFSVTVYKLFNIIARWDSFYDFILDFPIIIFALWALAGFLIFFEIFKNYYHGLVFVFLLAVLPVSVGLTQSGKYNEQILGAFLIFISIYFFIKASERGIFFIFLGLSLLGLVLTWQQFPVLYAGMLGYLLIVFIAAKGKNYRQCLFYLLAIGLPLISGHFISKFLVGIDYSPLSMIKELAIGAVNYKNEAINIAMGRRDWTNLNWTLFISYFGILGGIFIAAGLIKLLASVAKAKNLFIIIFGFICFLMMFFFVKDRFLALPVLFFFMVEGFDGLLNLNKTEWQRNLFIRLISKLVRQAVGGLAKIKQLAFNKKNAILVVLIILVIVLVSLAAVFRKFYKKADLPKPEAALSVSKDIQVGEATQVSITLSNTGGSAWDSGATFSGLHIEVENAEVGNIKNPAGGYNNVVMKKDAFRGNLFWFEVKFPALKNNEKATIFFNITPFAKPVNIYYRAWLPAYCSQEKQQAVLGDLRTPWQTIAKGGWRNEECIARQPANDSQEVICPVRVYAAHQETQDFKCFLKSF